LGLESADVCRGRDELVRRAEPAVEEEERGSREAQAACRPRASPRMRKVCLRGQFG